MLNGFGNIGSTSGGYYSPVPYFITKEPTVVKNITVPKGTTLQYILSPFAEGQQDIMLKENNIDAINLPEGKTIDWGGIPVTKFNATGDFIDGSNTKGFSISIDFNQLKNKTTFTELCQSCNERLSVLIKNKNDWSFNIENISDIYSCGPYQRSYKNNKKQQQFLDKLNNELKKY